MSRPGRAEERDVDPVGRCFERARDDLAGRLVAPEGVDRDAPATAPPPLGYGAVRRSGSISRPLYVWHVGQTRCGRLG